MGFDFIGGTSSMKKIKKNQKEQTNNEKVMLNAIEDQQNYIHI